MPTALVILAPGFEEIEAVSIIDVLRRAEIEVTVAGTEPGVLTASRGVRVGDPPERGPALLADLEHNLIQFLRLDVQQADRRALAGKGARDLAAHTASGSGDEYDLVS